MRDSVFTAVAATSATNAWAVTYAGHRDSLPPIMHWNGRRWDEVASPDIGIPYALSDVATTTANDVFAVGSPREGSYRALLLHWNGHSWKQVITPRPGPAFSLRDVTFIPHSGAVWAVYDAYSATVLLRRNGTAWH